MQGGDLDKRIEFEKRGSVSDGAGNTKADFSAQFIVCGKVKYLRGGESVMAARLTSRQAIIVTIRASILAQGILPDWRIKIGDEYFNIRERPTLSDNRLYLEFLAESGVAVG